MVEEKEEEKVEDIPTPQEKEEEGVKEGKVDPNKWNVGKMPTQFEPVIIKGDEVLDANLALAKILNLLEEIRENGGFKSSK